MLFHFPLPPLPQAGVADPPGHAVDEEQQDTVITELNKLIVVDRLYWALSIPMR